MWHEARKQERKIRGMLVDYRKRAERRQDFYEKIKADPTQFMQVHGRKCKIHLDPAIAAAGDSPAIMMPWQGQSDNLIDRFDVRAHLDYIQPPPKVVIDENEEITAEERQCNYERYRILAQNDFLTISEEKYLHQLYLEEQFGVNAQIETEKMQAKKKIGVGAAIGYTYEDSDQIPFNQTMQHIQQNTLMINNPQQQSQISQPSDKNDSDSDLDVDVPIDISKLDTSQAHELNGCGRNYGMKSNDFYSFLTKDADEADALRMAKEEEIEKNMYSGRKSRRERRAQREKRFIGRHISPPSYAAKEEPVQKTEENNDSDSRSPSPINSGKITYITSFGAEDELPPHSKISINFNKSQKPINSTLGAEILNTTADAKRPLTYAEKVKQNLEKLKTLNNMAGAGNGNNDNTATATEINKKPIQYQRRSYSGSRSRSRSRPRRNDISFNSRKRRNRSRTRSLSRSRSYNRRKSDSRSPVRHRSSNVRNSRRTNSRSKSRTRPRRKSRSRSRSYSNSKPSARTHRKYSTSSTSSSSSTTSVSSSTSSSSTTSSTSSKSRKSKAIKSKRISLKTRTKSSSSGTSSRSSSSSSSSSRSKSLKKNNLRTPKRSASSESRVCSPIIKKAAQIPVGKFPNSNATVPEALIPDSVVGPLVPTVAAPTNLYSLPENKEKEVTIKMESPPIKRYYGRKRDDATSSDDDDLSDDDDDDEDNNNNTNSNEPVNTPTNSMDVCGLNFTSASTGNCNNFGQTTIQPLINILGSVQGATIGQTTVIPSTAAGIASAVTTGTAQQSALITPTVGVGLNFYPNINNNLNLNNNSILGKTSTATSETKGGGNGNLNINNLLGQVPAAATGATTPLTGSTVVSAGITSTLKTFNKFNPRDRLKRKMQILLNKQYKADKKAEIERTERQIQQQQEREDEMRELALKLRRRQRELRHKYGTPTSGSRSPESKSGIILSGDENELINNSLIAQQQLQLQQQQQQQQNEIKNNLSKETIDKLQKKISSRSPRSKSRSHSTSTTNDCHHRDNSNYQYGSNNGDRRDKDYRGDSKYRDNNYRNRDYRYKNNSNKDSTRGSSSNINNNSNTGSSSSSSYRDRDRERDRDRRSNSRERRYKRSNDRTGSSASSSRSGNTSTTVRRLVDY